ncbi:ERT1 [Candida margitis]|uniref:ERT1 n=1 Tax=Candida margitis TaxID=1775924 RepID=UPI0022270D8E|nr:ERT1 [Candida margitis]KAI5967735.1 ERT1 [Candida margitis]
MNERQDIKYPDSDHENGTENENPATKPRRKKTSRACNHCHKAHMTCDSGRPCKRCIQRGLDQTCEDAPRKRKKYLDDVPNSSLMIKRTQSLPQDPESSHELQQGFSLNTTLQQPHAQNTQLQNNSTYLNMQARLQSRQSNERDQQVPPPQENMATHHQQHMNQIHPTAPQLTARPTSTFQEQYQSYQQPQRPQSLPQPNNFTPNHTTYQATLFQHSATGSGIHSTPDYYFQNSYNNQSRSHSHSEQDQQPLSNSQSSQQQQQQQQHLHPHNIPPNNENSPTSFIQYQKKSKFLSTAADLEYATLSNILQDNFSGHHTTSNEATPTSHNLSPNLSPHNMSNTPHTLPQGQSTEYTTETGSHYTNGLERKSSDPPSGPKFRNTSTLFEDTKYPKCDESINQYFIGKIDADKTSLFPDIITAIEEMKNTDYAVYQERNSKSNLSFSIGISHDENNSSNVSGKEETLFKEPEEIYAKVTKPFSYTPGYHSLIAYLRKRFPKPLLVEMAKSMAIYRPSFIACTNSLKEHDLIFMEQCFQRTLLTYDNFIKVSGTPTIVWRRTGEIAYVGDEFCVLTGWTKEQLIGQGQRKFIVELLDDKSVVEYFQVFSRIAFGDFLGATMTECTLLTPKLDVKIRTGCMPSPQHPQRPQLTTNLLFSVTTICLGSLQFGYHMAELNSPELVLTCKRSQPGFVPYMDSFWGSRGYIQCIPMSPDQIGLVTSIFSIGGLVGSFYVGHLADKYGRKLTSYLHCAMYLIGSILNGLANTFYALVFGRFICGLGAGSALVITSLYINEVSPTHTKGLLGSMNQVSINVGILFTQLLSLKWSNDNDWRWLLITAGVIAAINVIVLTIWVDESPMWLVNQGNHDQAYMVLHRLRGGSYSGVTAEVNSWKTNDESVEESNSLMENGELADPGQEQSKNTATLWEYIMSPEFRPSLIASAGVLILQQFDGINSIVFYGVSVLVSVFPNHSILINCLISLVNTVVTFGSATVVDKVGRKPLLLTSVSFLGVATVLMGFGIIWTNSVMSIIGTFTFITFFAIGLGPIPFLLVGEVTQTRAKASAQSFSTSLNWIATFIVGYLFPVLLHAIGGSVYFIFTVMCVFSIWFIRTYVPETKGKSTYAEVWSGN